MSSNGRKTENSRLPELTRLEHTTLVRLARLVKAKKLEGFDAELGRGELLEFGKRERIRCDR